MSSEKGKTNYSELLAAATIFLGLATATSYAFSLGYVFSIDPRLLGALTVGDLLFIFTSSSSTALIVLITIVPGISMLAVHGRISRVIQGRLPLDHEDDHRVITRERIFFAASTLIPAVVAIVLFIVTIYQWEEPYRFTVFPEALITCGFVISLLPTYSKHFQRNFGPAILILYVLAVAFFFGDVVGNDDLHGETVRKRSSCAFLESRPRCYPLLVIGAEWVIIRHSDHIILVPKDEIKSVQTRIGPDG